LNSLTYQQVKTTETAEEIWLSTNGTNKPVTVVKVKIRGSNAGTKQQNFLHVEIVSSRKSGAN
jgi:beta-lactamase superfamily II metal-dependent hydrolase